MLLWTIFFIFAHSVSFLVFKLALQTFFQCPQYGKTHKARGGIGFIRLPKYNVQLDSSFLRMSTEPSTDVQKLLLCA